MYEGSGYHRLMPVWTEFGMNILGNFSCDACQCVMLDWMLELCVQGWTEPLFSRLNHKVCCVVYFPLISSTYRWSKAGPERNHFSAGINPSLPQATHPQGTSWIHGSDNWILSHSLDTWRLSVLGCSLLQLISFAKKAHPA